MTEQFVGRRQRNRVCPCRRSSRHFRWVWLSGSCALRY